MYGVIYPYLWLCWNREEASSYLSHRREVRQNEALTPEAMQRLQWSRLTKLIAYSYEHVPFYRRRFDEFGVHPRDIRGPEDFRRIPVTTRSDVQEHIEHMVSDEYPRAALVRNATGGSTGTPVHFYQDRAFTGAQAAVKSRSDAWRGYRTGDKLAVIWGAERDTPNLSWFARTRLHGFIRHRRLNSYSLTPQKLEAFSHEMIRWQPRHIHAYAGSLFVFASYLRERGIDAIRPVAVSTSAEKLWDYQRALIEDAFRCRVFDLYGSREVPNVAAECEWHQGLHVNSDNVYLELVNDGGPVRGGEVGEVVLTPLLKRSMPLIRYRNGDLARASDRSCACGRPFPVLEEIVGRQNDLLVTSAGGIIHTPGGALFVAPLSAIPGMRQFQIHQRTLTDVMISVVAAQPVSRENLDRVGSEVGRRLAPDVNVEVVQVPEIVPGKSGKQRYIVSDVRPESTIRG